MLVIGLTGGIATGKTTVSSILSSPPHNLPIIDADILARRVVEPGQPAYRAIVSCFGPSTPDLLIAPGHDMPEHGPDGRGRPLNRPALGRRVFGDAPAARADRARLNAIVHPAVRRAAYAALARAYAAGHWAVVWDVPLLFEAGADRLCGVVLVVGVRDPALQMARLRARDPHLSAAEAEDRVRSQLAVRVKARRCEARGAGRGVVVWNEGAPEDLRRELDRLMGEIRRGSPAWWTTLCWVCPPVAVAAGVWGLIVNWRSSRRWEEVEARDRAKL